jgi:predicted Zn-dependent peptidase
MESTSSRATRLGKSVVTGSELLDLDEIRTRIEAVTAEDVAGLAEELLAPERLSAAGIGPSEAVFREAVEQVNPALAEAAAA